ncbi:hypothetical protein PPL_07448 [Heterostelium album PN500]|uniref:Uncharacterized protein n=1 Tax=Heterostelium pallidum (strain ATCC 26659 / Pp 5 / PN500) TaxID=670386 RepID=D3BFZ7_HETP5|nr:hypothetical protein PPL_07448 [Heterostelium album PN500]EFA79757.1 hypothetical protein PPL_07448 [Heterostelium album PN500]|eukprot:XP_020431878.1 hypothetical protein PPL_07448 [Heterostelium album PN500]
MLTNLLNYLYKSLHDNRAIVKMINDYVTALEYNKLFKEKAAQQQQHVDYGAYQQQQQQQPNIARETETRYDSTSNGQRRVSSVHRSAIGHITPNKPEDDEEEQTEWLLKDKSSINIYD